MISEESFDIVLRHSVEHAQERWNRTDDEHCFSPPQRNWLQDIQEESDHHIDTCFDHHAGHHSRHVWRGCRVSHREPDMKRDDACFRPETYHRKNEYQIFHGRWNEMCICLQNSEIKRSGIFICQKECQDNKSGADIRHNKIERPGLHIFWIISVIHDKEIRWYRHQFPCNEKE